MRQRRLLLLRHAKSSWADPALDDFDRPLAKRGRDAAPLMAAEMARLGLVPDLAIVSPALRTRQTWALVAPALQPAPDVTFEPTIYEAAAETILEAIARTPARVATLLIVGHNPGLEQLALHLAAGDSDAGAMTRLREKFPTGALAHLAFDGDWQDLAAGAAGLIDFIRPSDLDQAERTQTRLS